jgi:hypothetical protein
MRQDVKDLSLRIDEAIQLCKKVIDYGEAIRNLSPLDIGMDAYVEELTKYTESRGHATRIAIQELNSISSSYETIESDATATSVEKAFLRERMQFVQDLSPLFAKQDVLVRKVIEIHLTSLRKESAEFNHNAGVIKSYLKAPDKRNFYG